MSVGEKIHWQFSVLKLLGSLEIFERMPCVRFFETHMVPFHFAEFQFAETLLLLLTLILTLTLTLTLILTLGDLGFGELKFGKMKGHRTVQEI